MTNAVFCIASSEAQAGTIARRLDTAGCSNDTISMLVPDQLGMIRSSLRQGAASPPQRGAPSAALNTGRHPVLDRLAGADSLTIPGMESYLAAGPITAALGAVPTARTIGPLADALIELGMPEFEANLYERRIKQGNMLISVHTQTRTEARRVKDILDTLGAGYIALSRESIP